MNRLTAIFIILMTSTASAEVNSSDIASALEARYGPLNPNSSLSISVNSVTPYSGRNTTQEEGLPANFLAIVWDNKSDRFAALVKDETGTPIRIAGSALVEEKIPVLKNRLNVGDIISEQDIDYAIIPTANKSRGIIENTRSLIGKEIIRPISTGIPILEVNVASPTVVKRNQEVQIIYKKSGLQLISKGKSLSNAAVGDTVKIVRKDAARTLEGIAVSDGVVEINSGASN